MKAKGKFISTLMIIDAFFMGYAYGFNSRSVAVVNNSLPPLKAAEPSKAAAKEDKKSAKDKTVAEKDLQKNKSDKSKSDKNKSDKKKNGKNKSDKSIADKSDKKHHETKTKNGTHHKDVNE